MFTDKRSLAHFLPLSHAIYKKLIRFYSFLPLFFFWRLKSSPDIYLSLTLSSRTSLQSVFINRTTFTNLTFQRVKLIQFTFVTSVRSPSKMLHRLTYYEKYSQRQSCSPITDIVPTSEVRAAKHFQRSLAPFISTPLFLSLKLNLLRSFLRLYVYVYVTRVFVLCTRVHFLSFFVKRSKRGWEDFPALQRSRPRFVVKHSCKSSTNILSCSITNVSLSSSLWINASTLKARSSRTMVALR